MAPRWQILCPHPPPMVTEI
eukprot:gene26529-biopygen16768